MHSSLLFLLLSTAPSILTTAQDFPPIDLGYATHKPTFVNTTSTGTKVGLYNNIRFAQPPTGALRFRKPRTPPSNETGVQDGRVRLFASDCVSAVHPGAPFPGINGTTWGQEDCLFLNVWVPEGVKAGDKVPVLHWLHGSAWAFGSKDLFGDGFGLFDAMDEEGRFIFVASNYRMGLYGWTSSARGDMDANAGLFDAVAALEWTKKYIARFGGDPDRVTAMGQSAGASMITLMLVANGGNATLPFQKALLSSTGLMPRRNVTERREYVFDQALKAANCSSASCLRNASSSTLVDANKELLMGLQGGSGGGTIGPGIGLGPVPDGKYITDAATVLLQQGRFNKNIKAVISGNTAAEGFGMTGDVSTLDDFARMVRGLVPGASNATVRRIRQMYPYPDSQMQTVAEAWTTDVVYACNLRAVASAYGNRTHRYVFSVPPANHGLDSYYYFYREDAELPVTNPSLAREFQKKLLDILVSDDNDDDWPLYQPGSKAANITLDGIKKSVDPWARKHNCDVIMKIIMDRKNGA
ncbi:Alpha/Beta hydrolase protein [Aspergillus avenaceus]|uniref:Alpha/Beta hydrolase protein n=1 Tax=Aspergillus avenaceus TaxID=36643 RepID=A0A5N6TZ54_ASPAV|nr:Alpha/Beta hydrolase protein [Aspergillus avenaceus]